MNKTMSILAAALLLTSNIAYAQQTQYKLQPGDVIFQDLDCGDACDAIEKVTQGAYGMHFSHCGIVVQTTKGYEVVEAYGSVKSTPINVFLARTKDAAGNPKVLIGRPKDKALANKSAALAGNYIGKNYDDAFDITNDSYYCSELVYECYRKANDNHPYFILNKMTFEEPGTDKIMPFWTNYFNELHKPVPEGEPGINPGAMSRSEKLTLLKITDISQ